MPYHEAKKSVVPVVWVFKRKRLPDGTISKFKARICVRGDRMDDYEGDTYAPVVAWFTVWIMLVHSMLLGWKTKLLDISQAFV